MSILTKPDILAAYRQARIHIDPFDIECVGPNSVDVRLGEWVIRQRRDPSTAMLNPWNASSVANQWMDAERLPTVGELLTGSSHLTREQFAPFGLDDRVLRMAPGEVVLAHTAEFIGGRDDRITAMMKSRSSMGRSMIDVCGDAGVGDVGYHNRWTMEVRNHNPHSWILLGCGRRVAQLVFFEGSPVAAGDTYKGKYQHCKQEPNVWRPEDMLPRAYLDRENRSDDDIPE